MVTIYNDLKRVHFILLKVIQRPIFTETGSKPTMKEGLKQGLKIETSA